MKIIMDEIKYQPCQRRMIVEVILRWHSFTLHFLKQLKRFYEKGGHSKRYYMGI